MIKRLKRSNSDQLLKVAIAISIGLHFILFIVIYDSNNDKQSSYGHNQVILLESMADLPTNLTSQSVDTRIASQNTPQGKRQEVTDEQPESENNSQQTTINTDSLHTKTDKVKNTTNKGALIDQSGTNLTAEEHYRQLVTQHLLKKIKSAPTQGQAIINLHILKMGIATRINIDLISGSKDYQQWLKQQVLSANPLPAFSSDIKKASITLAIQISHHTE